jgi:glycerol-3-phosphate acyltransferase PlsY
MPLPLRWAAGIEAPGLQNMLTVSGARHDLINSRKPAGAITGARQTAARIFLAWGLSDSGAVKLALAIAVLVCARHDANIRPLPAGTEPRIGQHSGSKA